MTQIFPGRYTANIDGDFVVFIIGFRINRLWKVHKWWPVAQAMQPMLRALAADPRKGLLHASSGIIGRGPALIQYWRSFEDLEQFARNDPHLASWKRFSREVGDSGDVGIWHETYFVRAGAYECVYGNMPRSGLAAAGQHVRVAEKGNTAAQRIGAT